MSGATRLANSNYGGPHLIQNFPGVLGSQSFDGPLLKREQGHQVLPELPKDLGVIPAANAFVILQYSLRKARSVQFDIANNREL